MEMHGAPTAAGHKVIDPVCEMKVDPHTAKHRGEYGGRTYYFCSAGCRNKFLAKPEAYLSSSDKRAQPVTEEAIYTCPMHPEIRKAGRGSCSICGMALEPLTIAQETVQTPSSSTCLGGSGSHWH